MKISITLLALLVILNSCDKIRGCRPAKHTYTFEAGKQIDTARSSHMDLAFQYYTYQINSGSHMVFTYKYEFEDCPDIADDEGLRTILFEVPAGADHFKYTDSVELKKAKAILSLSCECIPYLPVFFKDGTIEGNRIDDKSWQVVANLKTPGRANQALSFNKVFQLP